MRVDRLRVLGKRRIHDSSDSNHTCSQKIEEKPKAWGKAGAWPTHLAQCIDES